MKLVDANVQRIVNLTIKTLERKALSFSEQSDDLILCLIPRTVRSHVCVHLPHAGG